MISIVRAVLPRTGFKGKDVIAAKAGIHGRCDFKRVMSMDARFRGNDGWEVKRLQGRGTHRS